MSNLKLENSYAYLIARITSKLHKELLQMFKSNGHNNITITHWAILLCLWQEDGQTQSAIAEKLDKEKANITRMLDAMEKNQLIQRRTHENDRRSYRIFLTPKGVELKDILIAVDKDASNIGTKGLSKKEKQENLRLLNIIYNNFADQK